MPPTVSKQAPKLPPRKTGGGGVLDRIKPVGFDPDDGLKVLLYGQSGSGKTTLWATFPGPILAVVCSGGVASGELRSVDTPEYRKKISSVSLNSSAELREILTAAPSMGLGTIVLDHVSGFADLLLKEVLGLDEIPAQKGWGLAAQQQYGQATMQAKEYLRAMLNLACNVVIIGQERVFNAKDEGSSDLLQPTVGVAVSPSLAGWLNPACDYVLQAFKRPRMEEKTVKVGGNTIKRMERGKGVEYCVRCEPHEVYHTKFRSPKGTPIPDVIVDPTYDKLLAVIRGEG